MIDVEVYRKAVHAISHGDPPGGQELILGEIVGAFSNCRNVLLPFPTKALAASLVLGNVFPIYFKDNWLKDLVPNSRFSSREVLGLLEETSFSPFPRGLYFGTPTIVGDKPLFPQDRAWTKGGERTFVRILCKWFVSLGGKVIVSGLGSGDISLEERIEDMGPGSEVIAFKKFNGFQDWVLERRL